MPARSMGSHSVACFSRAIRGQRWLPNYLSSDHDPLYKFHQWQANLRILEVTEIKTVPCVPPSHPLVERSLAPFDANIWITCCSGRVQIWRITARFQDLTSATRAPITHGKGERRIYPCHSPSPICARFAGNPLSRPISDTRGCLSFQRCALPAICRSPWAKTRNEIIRVGVLQFFMAARFANLAVSLPQHQFVSHRPAHQSSSKVRSFAAGARGIGTEQERSLSRNQLYRTEEFILFSKSKNGAL